MPSSIQRFVLPFLFVISAGAQQTPAQPTAPTKPIFKLEEVMIPVRDGVRLQTVILTPVDQTGPLPILFRRTPYGVPEKPPEQMLASIKELAQDGYTLSSRIFADASNPKARSIFPRGSTSAIPRPPTRLPMPTIRSTGW